jgi:hypothetical protein
VYTILVLDVVRWAADTQDRKQETALEHEAISVGGDAEPVEETFEEVELEELLVTRPSLFIDSGCTE